MDAPEIILYIMALSFTMADLGKVVPLYEEKRIETKIFYIRSGGSLFVSSHGALSDFGT